MEDQVPASQGSSKPLQDQASTAYSPVIPHTKHMELEERHEAMEDEGDMAQKSDRRKKRTLSFLSMPASTTSNSDSSPKRPKLSRAMRGNSMLENNKVQADTRTTRSNATTKRGSKVALSALELEDEDNKDETSEDVFDHVNIPLSGGQSPPTAQCKSRSTKNNKSKKAPATKTVKPIRKPKARAAKAKGRSNKASPAPSDTASSGESAAEGPSKADEASTLLAANISNAPAPATIQSGNTVSGSPSNLNLKSTEDIAALLSDFDDDFADNFDFSFLEMTKAEAKTSGSAKQQAQCPEESDIVQYKDEKLEAVANEHNLTPPKRDLSTQTIPLGTAVEDVPPCAVLTLQEENNIIPTEDLPKVSENLIEPSVNVEAYVPACPVALRVRTQAKPTLHSPMPAEITSDGSVEMQHASKASKLNSPATGRKHSAVEVDVDSCIEQFAEGGDLRACLKSMNIEPHSPVKPVSAIENLIQHATLADTSSDKKTKHIQPNIVTVGSKLIRDNDKLCKTLASQAKPNALAVPALNLQKEDQETPRPLKSTTLQETESKSMQSQRCKPVALKHEGLIAAGCRAPLDDGRNVKATATQAKVRLGLSKGPEYQSRLMDIPDDNQQSRKFCALSEPDEPTLTGSGYMQRTWPGKHETNTPPNTEARCNGVATESGKHSLPKIMQNGTGK